jgi:hypothetical protein
MTTVTITPQRGGSVSAPFVAQTVETIIFQGDIIPLTGTTLALLDAAGETIAQTTVQAASATLDMNTVQADATTQYNAPAEPTECYLVVGDTDSIIAIIPSTITRNPLKDNAPPTQLAPSYPTSESLLAILAEMTAQAQRAEDAVEATEKAQKAVTEYVDNTFPAKVEDANKTIAKAVTDGTSVITQTANQAIGAISSHTSTIVTALNQKQTQIEASIDTKAQAVNSALDNKITEANTALDGKVEQAEQAKDNAVKAKTEAETAKGQAEKSAKSASESAEQASTSAQQAEDAKDAIGDVSGRLDAVETSVGTLTETVEANNNVAKFTAYPNFVKSVCDALTATKQYGTISHPANSYPVNLVYTMANGWTIVAMEVPNNTSYLCVFDADWALLWSAKRSGDVRDYYQFVCEEVDGVAYVFGVKNNTTKTVVTITKGANGAAVATDESEVAYAEGVTSSASWKTNYAQTIGRYIVFADVVFDTRAMMVVASLSASIGMAWKGLATSNLFTNVSYANIGGQITEFKLDANGDIVITVKATASGIRKSSIPLYNGIFYNQNNSAMLIMDTSNRTKNKGVTSWIENSAIFADVSGTHAYGDFALPSQLYGKVPIVVASCKNIITQRVGGDLVAIRDFYKGSGVGNMQERVICSMAMYKPRHTYQQISAKVHGMDSKGLWMSFAQTTGWTQYHTLQGKLIRVLWEDLK